MIRHIWKRMSCPHRAGRTLAISYDGVTTVECVRCKALLHIPLSGRQIKPGIIYRLKRALSHKGAKP